MKRFMLFFVMGTLALACEEDQGIQVLSEQTNETIIIQRSNHSSNARIAATELSCEKNVPISITYSSGEVGSGSVSIDADNINILIDLTSNEWFITEIAIFVGDCNNVPAPSEYPFIDTYTTDEEMRLYERNISLAEFPACGCVNIAATISRYNASTSQMQSFPYVLGTDYCCEEPEEPDDKDLRTQTPGGWGAPPSGDNPGVYLHENFDEAFPGGLVVGCTYTITLTSAQAITDYLPNGGTSAALTKSYVNPNSIPKDPNNPKNVLAMHVVALTLSVTFDLWDEDFGESNTNLVNATITTGTFEGWTVGEVLEEAEKVLGGCASDYSAAQMTEVLTAINESYIDGNKTSDFLENH
jgi:hypothetical protein